MRKMFLVFIFLFPFLVSLSGVCDQIKDKEKELNQIQSQIEDEKKKEKELAEKEKKKKQDLSRIANSLKQKHKMIDEYKGQIVNTEEKLKDVDADLGEKGNQLACSTDITSMRLRIFYKNALLPAFSSGINSFYHMKDFFLHINALKKIVRQDEYCIDSLRGEMGALESRICLLDKDRNWLKHIKSKKEKERQAEDRKKKEEEERLAKIREDLKSANQRKAELAAKAEELEKLIKMLTAQQKKVSSEVNRKEAMEFERGKDNLPWPVAKGKIILYYGKTPAEKNKPSFVNTGIDIEVEGNEAVASVSKGTVMFGGEYSILGKIVIIDHGGGYCSVYKGMSSVSVKENQRVKEGDAIGTVGSVLHFEMRKNSASIDPLDWLKSK